MGLEHQERLEQIAADSTIIGIDEAFHVRIQHPLTDRQNRILAQPDLLIESPHGLYVIDYYMEDKPSTRIKTQSHLITAGKLLFEHYNWSPTHLFYAYSWDPITVDQLIPGVKYIWKEWHGDE